MPERRNAIAGAPRIYIEDHGILTLTVPLDFGGLRQDFGGYSLHSPEAWLDGRTEHGNYCGHWLYQLLAVFDVLDFDGINGKACRVEHGEDQRIIGIGHITRDIWFRPRQDMDDFKKRSTL